MAGTSQNRFLGWAILLACILAVPASMYSRSTTSTQDKQASSPAKRWNFLANKDHIQTLRLYGAIEDDDPGSSIFPHSDSGSYVKKKLRKAVEDENIKAILLRINSPGGTVGMSQEVYEAVEAVKKKGKPVIVSMGDITASGGYYIAAAADRIFANPGTLTGSIGVIMHLMNWQETEKKIGLVPAVIKSGQFKDIGSPDRAMTPEEKALLQNIIMDSWDQFVTAVADGRHLNKEDVKKLADGRIYSGRQALKLKLVDELGSYDDALAYVQKTCREKYNLKEDLPVDDGTSSMSFLSSLLESGSSSSSLVHPVNAAKSLVQEILPMSANPKFNKVPLWIMQ